MNNVSWLIPDPRTIPSSKCNTVRYLVIEEPTSPCKPS